MLNIQLKESFQKASKNISEDKTDYSTKKTDSYEQDDRRSVQSQISFQDELTATLKSRKATVKTSILTSGYIQYKLLFNISSSNLSITHFFGFSLLS